MKYDLLKNVIALVEEFEQVNFITNAYSEDLVGFKKWIQSEVGNPEPEWEGKINGRSPESVINTLIVHMNRYAKNYSKAVIHNSDFSTQEDFIYLINLKAFGEMSKMDLIKKNIQDKPSGMKIIERLMTHNWIVQKNSAIDKRSKVISISEKGLLALECHMDKIRKATHVVTGNLNSQEKRQLIYLLQKLESFHKPFYENKSNSAELLDKAYVSYLNQVTLKKNDTI